MCDPVGAIDMTITTTPHMANSLPMDSGMISHSLMLTFPHIALLTHRDTGEQYFSSRNSLLERVRHSHRNQE